MMAGSNGDTPHKVRFGRLLKQRRTELHYTQADIGKAGGPSTETIRQMERGEILDTVKPETLDRIDRVLRWAQGSSRSVLDGGEPTVLDIANDVALAKATRIDNDDHNPNWVPVPVERIQQLSWITAKLGKQMEQGLVPPAMRDDAHNLDIIVTDLVGLVVGVEHSQKNVARIKAALDKETKPVRNG